MHGQDGNSGQASSTIVYTTKVINLGLFVCIRGLPESWTKRRRGVLSNALRRHSMLTNTSASWHAATKRTGLAVSSPDRLASACRRHNPRMRRVSSVFAPELITSSISQASYSAHAIAQLLNQAETLGFNSTLLRFASPLFCKIPTYLPTSSPASNPVPPNHSRSNCCTSTSMLPLQA